MIGPAAGRQRSRHARSDSADGLFINRLPGHLLGDKMPRLEMIVHVARNERLRDDARDAVMTMGDDTPSRHIRAHSENRAERDGIRFRLLHDANPGDDDMRIRSKRRRKRGRHAVVGGSRYAEGSECVLNRGAGGSGCLGRFCSVYDNDIYRGLAVGRRGRIGLAAR